MASATFTRELVMEGAGATVRQQGAVSWLWRKGGGQWRRGGAGTKAARDYLLNCRHTTSPLVLRAYTFPLANTGAVKARPSMTCADPSSR